MLVLRNAPMRDLPQQSEYDGPPLVRETCSDGDQLCRQLRGVPLWQGARIHREWRGK